MSDARPEITRLLVAYNSAEALQDHARSSPPGPTLIVDNASTDRTGEVARSLDFDVLRLEANVGFGMGIMAGLTHLDAELVLVMNPDVTLRADTESELLRAAREWPECDLFVPQLIGGGGHVFFRHESRFEPRSKDRRPPFGDCCVPSISGAAMLIRRAPFIEFGGFDPEIFLFFEDDDIAVRSWRARHPAIYVHGAVAEHEEGSSSGRDARAHHIKDVSFGWSLMYVGAKHFGRRGWRDFVAMALKLLVYAISGRRQRMLRQWGRLTGAWAWLRGGRAPFRP
ncbi:MAG: glycosyltransferase family 2 protein [Pseudomonadota bacterium]